MTTRLVLIRHGITEWNKQGRYCGYKDVGLSVQGKTQVVRLRAGLKKIRFDRIYCSDRKRALSTRAILFGKSDFVIVKDLREINFGVLEGLRHVQILKKYSEVYKKWLADPFRGTIPQAEQMCVFKKRVFAAIKKIARLNSGKTVAVVCHGGVIGICISSILKSRDFWRYIPSPASITILKFKNNKLEIDKINQKSILR